MRKDLVQRIYKPVGYSILNIVETEPNIFILKCCNLLQMLFTAYLQLLFESGESELEIVPVVGFKKKKRKGKELQTFLVKPV